MSQRSPAATSPASHCRVAHREHSQNNTSHTNRKKTHACVAAETKTCQTIESRNKKDTCPKQKTTPRHRTGKRKGIVAAALDLGFARTEPRLLTASIQLHAKLHLRRAAASERDLVPLPCVFDNLHLLAVVIEAGRVRFVVEDACRNASSFLSTFPVSVTSLSWQTFDL